MYLQEFATGSVNECQFVANSAKLYGGALAQGSIFGAVQTSSFQSNTALHGGGIFQQNVIGDVQQGVFNQNVAGVCPPQSFTDGAKDVLLDFHHAAARPLMLVCILVGYHGVKHEAASEV